MPSGKAGLVVRTILEEARPITLLLFPRKREFKNMDPRLRGDDGLIRVSLGSMQVG